ncbi:MAG: isoaspartyl peptidase/L-asparaginase [bacterium]
MTVLLLIALTFATNGSITMAGDSQPFGLVMHGGAGTITRANMTPEMEQAYRVKLTEVLQTGYDILANGGTALDAVQKTINIMEDSPLFNAGKGSVYTHDGEHEMDASIMDGRKLNAGAVAAVRNVKNPIDLARLVMEKSKHVLLAGRGAGAFAEMHGLTVMPDEYFHTERRLKQLQKAIEKEKAEQPQGNTDNKDELGDLTIGTVGVAALDKAGNLAAGTSTGGMTNKRFGRVGDSPIIGAGTYANNKSCAVSATGHGEYLMRGVVAYDVSAMMECRGMTVQQAVDTVIQHKLTELGGTGGVVAMDSKGNFAWSFNTEGMYRGHFVSGGEMVVKIYEE